jgi:hypothetical protein
MPAIVASLSHTHTRLRSNLPRFTCGVTRTRGGVRVEQRHSGWRLGEPNICSGSVGPCRSTVRSSSARTRPVRLAAEPEGRARIARRRRRSSAMSAASERGFGSAYATPAAIFGDLSRGSTASASGSGSAATSGKSLAEGTETKRKPPFRPAADDTKPVLRDPVRPSSLLEHAP